MTHGMDKTNWLKIQKNWDFLRTEVTALYLLDNLISVGVLSHEDEQRIKYEPVDADKNEKLLKILKTKPSNLKAFQMFLVSLKQAGQKYVAEKLEKTEFDPEEIKEDTTVDLNGMVRELLLKNFVDEQGKSVLLPDVRNAVCVLRGRGVNFDWKDAQLKDFVLEVFSGVLYEPDQPARSNDIQCMSTDELCTHLTPIFIKLDLGESFVHKFQKLEIDGVVLLTMKEEDFKEEFSADELSFGKRRKFMLELIKIIEARTEKEENTPSDSSGTELTEKSTDVAKEDEEQAIASDGYKEYFRKFDKPVSPSDKYTRGRILELSGFSRENMISPVKRFLKLHQGDDIYRRIATEAVMFACACLNDRKNGTLYVGINPVASHEGQLGQVVGVYLDSQKCEDSISQLIAESFFEDQLEIAFQTIRSAKFVEVLNAESPNTWVVEVDVVPLADVVKNEAFFLKGWSLRKQNGKKKKKKEELYRLVDGSLQKLSEKEIYEYMKKKTDLTELRRQQEFRSSDFYVHPDLRKKILNLFTGGSETVEDEIYPVLMTSPLDSYMDEEYVKENLSFIQYFPAKVVFDFEPNNDSQRLYDYFENNQENIFEVHTTDNFDDTFASYSEKNIESLKMSSEKSWIFCNGYSPLEEKEMKPLEWKQNRSKGFTQALKLFNSSIPLGRGLVLIFLFGNNYEVLLEAAGEVILTFKDQWMVIAETEEVANLWKDEMTRRNVVSKKSMDSRCVLGMPWRHVNTTFTQIIRPKQTLTCEIPTLTGAPCILRDRDKFDLNDLEILGMNECDGIEELHESQAREITRRRVEESFFRGGQVEWLNFWFSSDHVLKRKQHNDVMDMVKKSLETSGPIDDDERVSIVTLIHQPGAGGSTSSRQILWDLRKNTRCCVVKRITNETANQIAKFRSYDEKSTRKPPLVLVDNQDEESFCQLILELEDKAKYAYRIEDSFSVFCTVLHCVRRVNLPKSLERNKVLLKHELQPWELSWFQKKYEILERKYMEDKKVNPKLLISFNILKTNFDADYIKRTVSEFMKEIDDTKESLLLKYLSVINSFDIDFQTIPISAFDPILGHQSKQKRILQFGILEKSGSRGKGWETTMSTSVRILVNESLQRGTHGTQIRTIRITSALLAKEILSYIEKNNSQQTSEIIAELLSSAIFDCENCSTFKLLNIIKNLVKRRQKQKEGRLAKFSPLVLKIMSSEGSTTAAEMCEEVHRKTKDPMIAQQIARFYIATKNWPDAEKYAKICTHDRPMNSFLWDTYGQVYRQQLIECYNRAKTGVKLNNENASKVISLAQKAIDIFRKEQVLSRTEKTMILNHGGYLGELRVTLHLMNIICYFESYPGGEELHRFLVDKGYESTSFDFLDHHEKEMLKSLGESAFRAIRKLEDELVHLKRDSREEMNLELSYDKRTLVELKENINVFFGEDSDDIPADLCSEDACEYRRRRVRRIGLTSLQGALALKYEANGEENLQTVYSLIIQNVTSEFCTAFDLVTILNTVVALHLAQSTIESITYSNILTWSLKLFEARQPDNMPYLETYLYLVLFHLPTESRRTNGFRLCSEVKIQEALVKWKDAFYKSYPRQRDTEGPVRRKDTTLFFLGRGVGLKEIVYQKEVLHPGVRMRDDMYWQSDQARKRFQRIEGILLVGGLEVRVELKLPGGNKFHITIPTSLPTLKRSMWQKRVFFVFGFSWSGPKAYDITLDDPSNGYEEASGGVIFFTKQTSPRGHSMRLADVEKMLVEVEQELEPLKNKKSPLSKNEKQKLKTLERKQEDLMNTKTQLGFDVD